MVFKTGMKILICIPRTSVDAEDMLMRAPPRSLRRPQTPPQTEGTVPEFVIPLWNNERGRQVYDFLERPPDHSSAAFADRLPHSSRSVEFLGIFRWLSK